jgi:hypothetical protein
MKINEIKNEFEETKENLFQTLDEKVAALEVTKEELEEYKKHLIEKKLPSDRIELELKRYHIIKKLDFVLNEDNIHKQLDVAIAFLDKAIKHITQN